MKAATLESLRTAVSRNGWRLVGALPREKGRVLVLALMQNGSLDIADWDTMRGDVCARSHGVTLERGEVAAVAQLFAVAAGRGTR